MVGLDFFLLLSLFTYLFTSFFFFTSFPYYSLFISRVWTDFAKYGDVAFLFLPKLHPTHNAQPALRPNDRLRRKGSSLSIKKEQVPLAKNRLSLGCRAIRFIFLSDRLIISFSFSWSMQGLKYNDNVSDTREKVGGDDTLQPRLQLRTAKVTPTTPATHS